jgi:hypothetical protein
LPTVVAFIVAPRVPVRNKGLAGYEGRVALRSLKKWRAVRKRGASATYRPTRVDGWHADRHLSLADECDMAARRLGLPERESPKSTIVRSIRMFAYSSSMSDRAIRACHKENS